MSKNNEWLNIVASLHGLSSIPYTKIESIEEFERLEDWVINSLSDLQMDTLRTTLNVNEPAVDSNLAQKFSSYLNIAQAFNQYLTHRGEEPQEAFEKYLLPIGADKNFSGKFRSAVKFIRKNPEFTAPKIALKTMSTNEVPYTRLIAQENLDEPGLMENYRGILNIDPIIRYEHTKSLYDVAKRFDITLK